MPDAIIFTPTYPPLKDNIKSKRVKLVPDEYNVKLGNVAAGEKDGDVANIGQLKSFSNDLQKQITTIKNATPVIKYPVVIAYTPVPDSIEKIFTLADEIYPDSAFFFYGGSKQDSSQYSIAGGKVVTFIFAPDAETTLELMGVKK